LDDKIKLEEDECICPLCDGGGSYPKRFAVLEDPYYARCYKCCGTGKLDWIDLCVGKRIPIETDEPCPTFIANLFNKGTSVVKSDVRNRT